jgi:DNA repair exonuclease SbcCD ATPase subunit
VSVSENIEATEPQSNAPVERLKQIGTQLAEFDKVGAGLADLRQKYQGIVYEVDHRNGMDAAKEARAALREPRYKIERLRKEFKAPLIKLGKDIDKRAKEITEQILEIEEPIVQQIELQEAREEAERARKAQEEQERVERLQSRVQEIRALVDGAQLKCSSQLNEAIAAAETMQIDDSFQEFRDQASAALATSLMTLRKAHTDRIAYEAEQVRIAEERAELDRLREEQKKRELEEAERRAAEEKAAAAKREAEIADLQARLKAEREENERIARERQAELDRQAEAQRKEREDFERQQREHAERVEAEQRRLAEESAAIERERADAQRAEVSGVESREGIADTQQPEIRPDREPGEETSHPATGLARGAVLEPDQQARDRVTTVLTSPNPHQDLFDFVVAHDRPLTDDIVSTLMDQYDATREIVVSWLISAVDELLDQVEA